MGSDNSPGFVFFISLLTFGVVFCCVTLHARVQNAAPPAMSRTTFYFVVTVPAVLFTFGIWAYSSYMLRTASSVSLTVDHPKQPPDVFVRPK